MANDLNQRVTGLANGVLSVAASVIIEDGDREIIGLVVVVIGAEGAHCLSQAAFLAGPGIDAPKMLDIAEQTLRAKQSTLRKDDCVGSC